VNALRHPLTAIAVSLLLTLPWVVVTVTGASLPVFQTVALSGVAVLGASFLLTWGAETAEKDVPRAFAIAVLAVLAVAPEYAVDALYAWSAGSNGATAAGCSELSAAAIQAQETALAEGCHDANLAVANMTGANRILIGLGWAGIAIMTVLRAARVHDSAVRNREGLLSDAVILDRSIATEIGFLALATLWAFLVPLFGGIDALDTFILVGIYVVYIGVIIRSGHETEGEHIGVPHYLQSFSFPRRVVTVFSLFGYSGLMIFTAVEPFAHGLEEIGLQFGVPEFFMIQWIAPLASESPELIVVSVLVLKSRSTAGFNALISSKLNQWTLLIGTLAVVYSLALGGYGVLPFDEKQALEIWITAAQSYFALAVLINFNISVREALVLLVLFVTQVVIEFLIIRDVLTVGVTAHDVLLAYTVVYIVLGTLLFVARRRAVKEVFALTADTVREAVGGETATRPAD
jgi:cation:H+ antiporter